MECWADYDLLPQGAADLADVIGLAALEALVTERGGTCMDIPRPAALHDDHVLVCTLGWSAARTLCEHYQGEDNLYIPRCLSALRAARDAEILALSERGWSATQLALRYRLTDRQIYAIRARGRAVGAGPTRQGSLFG